MEARPIAWFLVLILVSAAYTWPVWIHKGLSDKLTSIETSIQEQGSRLEPIAALVDKVAALESAVLGQRGMLDHALGQGLSDKFTSIETSIQEQGSRLEPIAALVDKVAALESAVLGQRGMLDHALGHGVPVQMSDQWNTQLETLEKRLSEQAWPAHADEAAEFLAAVSALVSELSPLAEATYFARLARLRWSAVAFDALRREHVPEEVLFDQVEQLRAIADAKPEDVDTVLEEALLQRGEKLLLAAEESAYNALVARARRLLDSPDALQGDPTATPQGDSSQGTDELQEVYDDLGAYLDHATHHADVENLREKIGRRLLEYEARERAAALNDQWKRARRLVGEHDDAYEAAARMLLDEVTGARAMTALSDLQTTEYDGLVAEIQAAVHDVHDGFRRAYQKWALGQLSAFEARREQIESGDALPSEVAPAQAEKQGGWWSDVIDQAKDAIPIFGDPSSRQALQNAMVRHLLPIDHLLLDLPVLKRYQRVYDAAWAKLEGRNEQTCVAIAAAIVPKRTLRDVGDAATGSDVGLVEELRSREECE